MDTSCGLTRQKQWKVATKKKAALKVRVLSGWLERIHVHLVAPNV